MGNFNTTEKFFNKHSEYIYNIMENEVVEEVKSMTARDVGVCKCEQCMYNISAIALNNLKPRYATTHKGELFARVGQISMTEKTQIKVEVARAIEVVKSKKMHD